MNDRVVLSDDNFTTRDASNNITFSSDRYYVKNDPTGNFFLGGINPTAVLAGAGNSIPPKLYHSGRVLSFRQDFQISPPGSTQLNSGNFSIPVGTTKIQGNGSLPVLAGLPQSGIGIFRYFTSVLKYNGNIINYNFYINGKFITTIPLEVAFFIIADMSGLNQPPNHILGVRVYTSNVIANVSSTSLREGGVFSWSPNFNSFNSSEIINAGSAPFVNPSQPAGTVFTESTTSTFGLNAITQMNGPLSVSGEQTRVDLKVTP